MFALNTDCLLFAHALTDYRIELLGGLANLIIACCYFSISILIMLGLWRNRKAGIDVFATVTGAIFFSCAMGHTFHATEFLGTGNFVFWKTSWDWITVVPAIAFLSLHKRYNLLIGSTQVLESHKELEKLNVELEQKVAQRTEELEKQNQLLKEALKELQQMQMHLVQTEKMSMLGQMLSGIAHEINNPVNFIYGNLPYILEYVQDLLKILEVYQSNCQPNAAVEEALEEVELDYICEDLPRLVDSIKLGADRIRELVQNLRNFYRLDESQMKPAELNAGIESTLVLLNNLYKGKIEIVQELNDLPLVECHINQINQVFMNLISNAVDALQEVNTYNELQSVKKQIVITSKRLGNDRVSISISDNGNGIKPEVLERLFEPFFTTKPIGVGTGLGLSISYNIVKENHQGKIYCKSTLGKGTTFTVELPICQEKQSEAMLETDTREAA